MLLPRKVLHDLGMNLGDQLQLISTKVHLHILRTFLAHNHLGRTFSLTRSQPPRPTLREDHSMTRYPKSSIRFIDLETDRFGVVEFLLGFQDLSFLGTTGSHLTAALKQQCNTEIVLSATAGRCIYEQQRQPKHAHRVIPMDRWCQARLLFRFCEMALSQSTNNNAQPVASVDEAP